MFARMRFQVRGRREDVDPTRAHSRQSKACPSVQTRNECTEVYHTDKTRRSRTVFKKDWPDFGHPDVSTLRERRRLLSVYTTTITAVSRRHYTVSESFSHRFLTAMPHPMKIHVASSQETVFTSSVDEPSTSRGKRNKEHAHVSLHYPSEILQRFSCGGVSCCPPLLIPSFSKEHILRRITAASYPILVFSTGGPIGTQTQALRGLFLVRLVSTHDKMFYNKRTSVAKFFDTKQKHKLGPQKNDPHRLQGDLSQTSF